MIFVEVEVSESWLMASLIFMACFVATLLTVFLVLGIVAVADMDSVWSYN